MTTITATESTDTVSLDKAGYFVVVPLANRRVINVEHYAYDDTLLHVVEGTTARALYLTIVANQWVSELILQRHFALLRHFEITTTF